LADKDVFTVAESSIENWNNNSLLSESKTSQRRESLGEAIRIHRSCKERSGVAFMAGKRQFSVESIFNGQIGVVCVKGQAVLAVVVAVVVVAVGRANTSYHACCSTFCI
jgi:hypothetical protein